MEIRDRVSRKNSWITCEGRKEKKTKRKRDISKGRKKRQKAEIKVFIRK
jgi:hypothetical protein